MVAQATGGRRQLSCPRFDAASRKATLACHAPSEGTVTGNPLLGRRDPGTGGDGDCATNITVTPAPAPAIKPARPVRNHESLIDRTIDLERYGTGVRSEISLDHGLTTNHQHHRGWLTSSRQYQGTFDSEDNSVLFSSPRGVIKLAPFFPAQAHPCSSSPQNVPGTTGMGCGVLSTAFASSPICASTKAKYASAADPHAMHAIKSATSQERTADLSESQTNSELRFAGIAGGLGP